MKTKPDNYTPGAYLIYCPGCHTYHSIAVGEPRPGNGAQWRFNNDLDAPTFRPSVKLLTGTYADPQWTGKGGERCTFMITAGNIQFADESTHALAGFTVSLPEL